MVHSNSSNGAKKKKKRKEINAKHLRPVKCVKNIFNIVLKAVEFQLH